MKKTKNAASGVADQKRQDQTGLGKGSRSSQYNISTNKMPEQGVSSFLAHGKGCATSSSALMKLLGNISQRELRAIISKARENGEIILSNSNGYFLPSPGEEGYREIAECVSTLHAKGLSTLRAAEAIKKPLQNIYGQEIFGELKLEEGRSLG